MRKRLKGLLIPSRVVPIGLLAAGIGVAGLVAAKSSERAKEARLRELQEAAKRASERLSPSSSIFVVENCGAPEELRHPGLDRLINLMGKHGLCFYRTEKTGDSCSPTGLIAADDVVLIKVNCQWDKRGGTNTDVLKGLIYRITQHPDGFTGEIVVADNGQEENGGGSLNWPESNAEDHGQSVEDVVRLFSDRYQGSYKVSTYLWTNIRNQKVQEFDQGDMTDGYVLAAQGDPNARNFRASYPKFTTTSPYGTRISFKRGIFKADTVGGTYDKEKLKVINVPVLKAHYWFGGVTACVKHYMGVQSQPLSGGHSYLHDGSMGTLFAQSGLPALNILDAIYVNANPEGGPGTSYARATKADTLMASLDPFALDYWASKNVLMAEAGGYEPSMDPDNPSGNFHRYLENAKNIVLLAGYAVTTDPKQITVYRETFAPVITLQGDNPLTWECGTAYVEPGYTATGESEGDLTGEVVVTGSVDHTAVGSYTLHYNVTDSFGNPAEEKTRTVNVVDTTGPVITLSGGDPLTWECCTPYVDPGYTATDTCYGDLTGEVVVTGSVDHCVVGSYTLRYNVSDPSRNSAEEKTRTVNVVDTTPPVITLEGDNPLTLECGTPYVEPGYSPADTCEGDLTDAVVVTGSVDHTAVGSYILRYNVSDSSGNSAEEKTRTVNVVDTTRPVITLSGDDPMTLECGTQYVEPGYTATDICDGDLTAEVLVTGSADHTLPGSYALRYNVEDSSGNSAQEVTRVVEVVDSSPPVITLLGDVVITLEVGTPYEEPGYTATDMCGGDLTADVGITGSVDPDVMGSYILRYNVSDWTGNAAEEKTRTVNVVEAVPFEMLEIIEAHPGTLQLTWNSRLGATYTVWSCVDLGIGPWNHEATVASEGGTTSWTDSDTACPCKFYRIEIE